MTWKLQACVQRLVAYVLANPKPNPIELVSGSAYTIYICMYLGDMPLRLQELIIHVYNVM
jgi:hypothetical protein